MHFDASNRLKTEFSTENFLVKQKESEIKKANWKEIIEQANQILLTINNKMDFFTQLQQFYAALTDLKQFNDQYNTINIDQVIIKIN